jgi:hypothetical protein
MICSTWRLLCLVLIGLRIRSCAIVGRNVQPDLLILCLSVAFLGEHGASPPQPSVRLAKRERSEAAWPLPFPCCPRRLLARLDNLTSYTVQNKPRRWVGLLSGNGSGGQSVALVIRVGWPQPSEISYLIEIYYWKCKRHARLALIRMLVIT